LIRSRPRQCGCKSGKEKVCKVAHLLSGPLAHVSVGFRWRDEIEVGSRADSRDFEVV
jgi:hypothetical protein